MEKEIGRATCALLFEQGSLHLYFVLGCASYVVALDRAHGSMTMAVDGSLCLTQPSLL